jgi:hypothetical protein
MTNQRKLYLFLFCAIIVLFAVAANVYFSATPNVKKTVSNPSPQTVPSSASKPSKDPEKIIEAGGTLPRAEDGRPEGVPAVAHVWQAPSNFGWRNSSAILAALVGGGHVNLTPRASTNGLDSLEVIDGDLVYADGELGLGTFDVLSFKFVPFPLSQGSNWPAEGIATDAHKNGKDFAYVLCGERCALMLYDAALRSPRSLGEFESMRYGRPRIVSWHEGSIVVIDAAGDGGVAYGREYGFSINGSESRVLKTFDVNAGCDPADQSPGCAEQLQVNEQFDAWREAWHPKVSAVPGCPLGPVPAGPVVVDDVKFDYVGCVSVPEAAATYVPH